jgi:hypothetical protein
MGVVFGKQSVAEPAYDVLMHHSQHFSYEIRRYGQRYAAETRSTGDSNNSNDSSFRLLAQYIGVFGTPENSAQEAMAMTAPVVMEDRPTQIAMTAPVIQNDASSDVRIMQFILPKEYDSLKKIPKPTNNKVTIKSIPPAVGAVHQYAGSYSQDNARKKAQELCQQLRKDGLDITEDFIMENYQMWAFNPPFTLPMFRRNEVWIELTEAQVDRLVNGFQASQAN